ncbi:hypothetical protein [Marinimicrobium alkaliphilum]|uniref:hypothetical protein n=1 Tax=Marinimicrobium alkaliphilum TaxID=2202654 RepID=UPI000DB9DCB0|nr:hypothetical protein [Marinimicrobium alkaliphilum]
MNLAVKLTPPAAFLRLLVTFALALGLTACGSSSSDDEPTNGNGNGGGTQIPIGDGNFATSGDIDMVEYGFPAGNATLTYQEYDVDLGENIDYGTYTETWTRDGNEVSVTSSMGFTLTATIHSDRISMSAMGFEVQYPRFVNSGSAYIDDEDIREVAFGPYSSYTFEPGGGFEARTYQDVVIVMEHDKEYEDVYMSVFVKGEGSVGSKEFWGCPDDVTLDPTIDYTEVCGTSYYLELLVED